MVASDISCTPASSAKMPLALDGMPLSKLMLRCTSWAWSMPDANLVAGDERMVKARAPALALMPSWPISTSTPAALSCEAPTISGVLKTMEAHIGAHTWTAALRMTEEIAGGGCAPSRSTRPCH